MAYSGVYFKQGRMYLEGKDVVESLKEQVGHAMINPNNIRGWEDMQVRLDKIEKKVDTLVEAYMIAVKALDQIRDPRKRHREPDKYTEVACVMNIADEAIQQCEKLGMKVPESNVGVQEYGIVSFDVHKL